MKKIGIVGNGYVGGATALFKNDKVEVLIYDKDPRLCEPSSTTLVDLVDCDFVFVCVPTPMDKDGGCHTPIVESCVYELNMAGIKDKNIVIRSTVPVGLCESLGVNFMPEFLTEANWEKDFENNNAWVFGLYDINCASTKSKFTELIAFAKTMRKIKHDDVFFCSNNEAELSKLVRNSFLATKVSFFNEIYDFCEKKNINYGTVSDLVGIDKRIGRSHTMVPGPDGERGFGGTCFPKDIASLKHQMTEIGMESYMLEAAEARNIQVDRKEQDWKLNKGRAVI